MAPALSFSLQPGGSASATETTAGARQRLLWLSVGESGAKSVTVHIPVLLRHYVGKSKITVNVHSIASLRCYKGGGM